MTTQAEAAPPTVEECDRELKRLRARLVRAKTPKGQARIRSMIDGWLDLRITAARKHG